MFATLGLTALVGLALVAYLLAFAVPARATSSLDLTASPPAAEVSSSASPAADPSPSPDPATLTCELSRTAVVFGDTVTAIGMLTPAAPGEEVVITVAGVEVGRVPTDAAGSYKLTFTPRRGGAVIASLGSDSEVASSAQQLAVKPGVRVSHGALVPFLASKLTVGVSPAAYSGVVTVTVVHRKVVVGRYRATVRNGRAVFRIPLRGVDTFALKLSLAGSDGLAARTLESKAVVRARTLSAGSRGAYVKGMLTGLQRLAIRIPGMGTTFTAAVKDSVMAFQKAYRLRRTYVFDTACWRKLDGAVRIKPRFSSPSTHLEVDKGRQILMVVKGGKVYGLICVSTGATGNTPEGSFRIQQKHSFTTSGYGGILVRTMGFIADFAIHGYTPVPPYPASHGCVREPIWACYWVYDQSWVGETLYVYH